MRKFLEDNGWVMYHECNTCKGHMQHFSHPEKPGYEIRTRIRSNTFSILLKNHIVGGPFWGYQIEQKLTEHVK